MGRILGVDHGKVRIGLALSDPLHVIASPLKTLSSKDSNEVVQQILNIIYDNEVELVVIGVPFSLSGKPSLQTEEVRKFIVLLRDRIKIPIIEAEERLSTVEALRILKQKGVKTGHHKEEVDKIAAAIILQTYLDSQKRKNAV